MRRQCVNLQQPCIFIDAVAGGELTPAIVTDVSHHAKMRLSRNEVGCFLSHKKCWQKIVDDKLQYAIVVEDDIFLDKELRHMSTYISQLDSVDPNWDLLYLAFNQETDFKAHFLHYRKPHLLPANTPQVIKDNMYNDQFWMDKETSSALFMKPYPRWGMFGSVISLKGATKLLKMLETSGINYPVDWQLWFAREPQQVSGLHSYALSSACKKDTSGKFKMMVTHPYTFHSNLGHQGAIVHPVGNK